MQERNIGLLIFSEMDAFLGWALSELRRIYILVYSKKALYFLPTFLVAVQKIFKVTKPSSIEQLNIHNFQD